MILPVLGGLAAGAGHALSGPDHVAAVLPLAASRPGPWAGVTWGLGHGLGVVGLGALGVAFGSAFDVDRASGVAEVGAGGALIATGLWAVWRARESMPSASGPKAALGVGVVHGAAGAAHLTVAAAAMALSPGVAVGWLAAFVAGAAAAMGVVAWSVGRGVAGASADLQRRVRIALGVVAMTVGVVWIAA